MVKMEKMENLDPKVTPVTKDHRVTRVFRVNVDSRVNKDFKV